MIKFSFIAQHNMQNIPLEVSLDYRPGKQAQRARRIAVGELLAVLEAQHATVDASSADQVTVTVGGDTWVIGESAAGVGGRGSV